MKETCRICGRELCGNQRRWIFHPTAKLNLQVLLSHALGQELTRDGRGEFACSKCTFMLDRMYRFDTVIARVEALSIKRLQRLLQEKHRLRQCIGGLYRKTNSEDGEGTLGGSGEAPGDGMVDISGLTHAKYCALLQDDLVYSLYESWMDDSLDCPHHHHLQFAGSQRCVPSTPRRCRGCSYWRVADSDYEAVCKVPRKLARSFSCGPSTRYSASVTGGSVMGASSSPSVASLEIAEEYNQPRAVTDGPLSSPRDPLDDRISDSLSEEHTGAPHGQASPALSIPLALCLLQSYAIYRPVQSSKGSKLPVLLRQSSRNGNSRLGFPDPLLGMSYESPDGERDNHMPTPELDTPLIRLDVGLVEEQQSQLNQYECAAGQCVSELQKAQLQVQSLQAKIHESEANNMKLQEKLNEMECELRSLRQAGQSQERTIQGLTDSISTKDSEAQELYQMIEGQNTTLCKLREMAHRNQLGVSEALTLAQLQGELMGVQSSLFSLGLELEASQRSLRQSQRQGDDLARFKDRLNSDLQEALQYREVTEKHNQVSVIRKEPRIAAVGFTPPLLCLQRSIDDKFRCLEEREGQVRRLQLALREKERDLERLRCILSNNEETITSLDSLVRGKELELEQAAEAYRNLQWLKQQSEEKERNTLREKDTIINQLQAALQRCSQETQVDLTAALVARAQAGPTEVVEELKARLELKEKLFQELLADHSRQSNEHQTQVQDLLNTLSSKDQYLQVSLSTQTELMQGQEEAMRLSSKENEAEMKALQEELQLALKKEREAQVSG
uniref:Short myomegalin-like EB1 binding protein N-terminal domain-containing protein n=1 Tax=Echeneis naucrates TaxID=173247 RepID=A0A665T3I6_ECHNA